MIKNKITQKANEKTLWHLVDAQNRPLGKIATEASILLRGKKKVNFKDYLDCGDHVIIINSLQTYLSGNKTQDKKYFTHSGYPGNLKKRLVSDIGLSEALKKAIFNMLPKNKLRPIWMRRLHIYETEDHPHKANIAHKLIDAN